MSPRSAKSCLMLVVIYDRKRTLCPLRFSGRSPLELVAIDVTLLSNFMTKLKIIRSIVYIFWILVLGIGVYAYLEMPSDAELIQWMAMCDQVNERLGFEYATPEDDTGKEVFLITNVVPNGVMSLSDVRPGDQIRMRRVDSLYTLLLKNRGSVASISVLRKGLELEIQVKVPTFKLKSEGGQPNN